MKLVIAFDDGDCEVVIDEIETCDFGSNFGRNLLVNKIERVIDRVKAFQAATPPESGD